MNTGANTILAEARRRKGLTQSQVADAVGCKQSAISMFENGRKDALSGEKLSALSKLLDVEAAKLDAPRESTRCAYCPDPQCPSNVAYPLRGQIAFHPTFVAVEQDDASYCALCGEVMETRCLNAECRAAPRPGAFCRQCGAPYVSSKAAAPEADAATAANDAQRRTRSLLELTAMLDSRLSKKGISQP